MKLVAAITALLLSTAPTTVPHARAQDGHQHHAPAPVVAQAVPAQRWNTDASLRKGMGQIRTAVDALQHYEQGHMGPEQAVALAADIHGQVAYLIANCKLEPQADAALHGIIAELSTAAHALKTDPANLTAIPPMRTALADYARSFDDPDFRQDAAVD